MIDITNKLALVGLLSAFLILSPIACSTAPRRISEPAVKAENAPVKEKEPEEITPTLDDLRGYLLPAR
ncbi:MAG: hypothetical protein JXR73_04195 [Candidatus Omnitrophica bacterium]|nr:hypothetical protein [Candidatus Omnitrophota bacterium]